MSHGDHHGLWDVGLQPERTSLAWLRTCLGLAGGALLTTRVFLVTQSWAAAWVVVVLIGVGTGLVWWGAQRRSGAIAGNLRRENGLARGPGACLLVVTVMCACAVTVVNAVLVFLIPSL
ncbi:DUF202 domain-containing protein [Terrabacter sp. GCM10028922]|uniref:DUF202 domain-containing protein n=1 Tax=Terrabacter sp. GCM10028922 TaxID=3273428 RepID=UPI003622F82E